MSSQVRTGGRNDRLLRDPVRPAAERQPCQVKDGCGGKFTTLHSMAVIQATTATTLNRSPGRKQAAGKNTKMKLKLAEPPLTPLRGKLWPSHAAGPIS